MNRREIERAAVRAHAEAIAWDDFYCQHAATIAGVEPWDLSERSRLIRRLSVLVAIGDLDGYRPVGDEAPWESDDAPLVPISDSETSARIDWQAAGVQPIALPLRSLTPGHHATAKCRQN